MIRSTFLFKPLNISFFKRRNHIVRWTYPSKSENFLYGCQVGNDLIYLKHINETSAYQAYQVVKEPLSKFQVTEIPATIEPEKILTDVDKKFLVSKILDSTNICKIYLNSKIYDEDFSKVLYDEEQKINSERNIENIKVINESVLITLGTIIGGISLGTLAYDLFG